MLCSLNMFMLYTLKICSIKIAALTSVLQTLILNLLPPNRFLNNKFVIFIILQQIQTKVNIYEYLSNILQMKSFIYRVILYFDKGNNQYCKSVLDWIKY